MSLIWLPIDYPKLPNIDYLLDVNNLNEGFAFWKFRRLTKIESSPYCKSDWDEWTLENCPQLVDWFADLPFLNIRNIKLNYQTKAVIGHIDFTNPHSELLLWNNNDNNEPCGYRILVKGSREKCLWVKTQQGNISCNMPDSTDVYVLNHTSGIHGVADDNDRWTIFCHAEINSDKHRELINQSLIKYNNYAILD